MSENNNKLDNVAQPLSDVLLKEIEATLTEYEGKAGLSKVEPKSECLQYLNCSRETLEKLDSTECVYVAIELMQYSLFIQRLYNREKSRRDWALSNIRVAIANDISQYKAYSYEEKKNMAIANNSFASRLDSYAILCQAKMTRLESLADKLGYLSRTFEHLIKYKNRDQKEQF